MRTSLSVALAFSVAIVGADRLCAQVEGSWEVVPSPNADPAAGGNTLLAVDALSPTDAWAVGFHHNPTYCTFCPEPLAIHWDGVHWSLVDTPTIAQPKVQLRSVTAVSSDDIWAVGHWLNDTALAAGTLIEHWDGTSWSVVSSPSPGMFSALYGVAASSSDDIWAVGDKWLSWSSKVPLILHYDGMSWVEVAVPPLPVVASELNSVVALAADDAWAVGVAVALHWDGASWTQVPIALEEYVEFTGVSGVASNDVWAVGNHKYSSQSGHTLSSARAYHWDGSSWTRVLYPGLGGQDSRFTGVHAIASNDVWAAGGQPGVPGSGVAFEYATAHWVGAAWTTVDTPNQGVLNAISGASSTDVWAVGWGFDSLGFSTRTYTLRYTPGDCPGSRGDANCDGGVNFFDIDPFVAALFDLPAYQAGFCGGSMCAVDTDCSGGVDFFDIDPLLACMFGGCEACP